MLTAAWLLLGGCNAQAGGGGAGPIPINQSEEPGDGDGGNSGPVIGGGTDGGDTDGGATDGSEPDTGGDGDVGTDGDDGDVSTDGDDSDVDTDGAQPDPGAGDDGGDLPPGVSPPSVVLSITNLSPSIGDTLFLTCVVVDSGGLVPFDYRFDSSAGSAFIVQNGSELASAEVLASPLTINYWCSASNAAGRGEPSPLVTVTVTGGGL
jgi:hypothetical protein